MENEDKPVVVIIEDDPADLQLILSGFVRATSIDWEDAMEVINLRSISELRTFMDEGGFERADVVTCDGAIQGGNVWDEVPQIRERFKGPMIAASGLPDSREKLVEAGCNANTPKRYLGEKLKEVLNIQ